MWASVRVIEAQKGSACGTGARCCAGDGSGTWIRTTVGLIMHKRQTLLPKRCPRSLNFQPRLQCVYDRDGIKWLGKHASDIHGGEIDILQRRNAFLGKDVDRDATARRA